MKIHPASSSLNTLLSNYIQEKSRLERIYLDNEPQTPMSQVLINGPTQNMNPNNASNLKGSFIRRGWGGMARFQARVWGLAKLSNFPGFCHLENGSFKLGSLYDPYHQKDANKPNFPGLKFWQYIYAPGFHQNYGWENIHWKYKEILFYYLKEKLSYTF